MSITTIEEILYTRDLVDSHCADLQHWLINETIINKIEALYLRMENAINENNVAEFYTLINSFIWPFLKPVIIGVIRYVTDALGAAHQYTLCRAG